ncbi:MAG: TonB-dependent receptor plug domain-containing protein, partial [Pseudomonadota bacterium]
MLGVAAAAFAGGKAAADEAPGSPPASSSAFKESPEAAAPDDLGDVITVFATRNESRAFEYPGAVSVLERDVIDDFNLSTVSELFAAIPGAQFDSGARRTGDAPAVRGLSGAGVQVFFDGARQSFLSGHDGRFFIDPELLKSVEVVRGEVEAVPEFDIPGLPARQRSDH